MMMARNNPSVVRDFIEAARTSLAERQQRIAREHELACVRLHEATTDEQRAAARAEVLRLEKLIEQVKP